MAPQKHPQPIEKLTAAFVERLTRAMEREVDARSRVLVAEWASLIPAAPAAPPLPRSRPAPRGPRERAAAGEVSPASSAAAATAGPTVSGTPLTPASRRRSRVRARAVVAAPAPDPEQQSRDAELAHLRAVLRPTAPEETPAAPRPAAHVPVVPVDWPPDPMRALEDEVREQVPSLARLPPAGYTARIAAWAGRVRSYEETAGNRIAAQLLLDKLRALAHAMEAGRIEALSGSWRTTDWPAYIRKNEALAEAPPPAPPTPTPTESSNDDEDPSGVWR